jgi:hypothetical protein
MENLTLSNTTKPQTMSNQDAVSVMSQAVQTLIKCHGVHDITATTRLTLRILNDAIGAEEWESEGFVERYSSAIKMAQSIAQDN